MGMVAGLTNTSPEMVDMQQAFLLLQLEMVEVSAWSSALDQITMALVPSSDSLPNPTVSPNLVQVTAIPSTESAPINESAPLNNSVAPTDSVLLNDSVTHTDSVPCNDSVPHNDSVPRNDSAPSTDSAPLNNSISSMDSVPLSNSIDPNGSVRPNNSAPTPTNIAPKANPKQVVPECTEKRKTTSGKSVEVMELVGLIKRKRVTLLLGKKGFDGRVEGGGEDSSTDGPEDHMEVDGLPREVVHIRPQRKKR